MKQFDKVKALTEMYLEALMDYKKIEHLYKEDSWKTYSEVARIKRLRVELTKEMKKFIT